MLLLPLTLLHQYNACDLPHRIEKFQRFYGHMPREFTTFQQWLAVTPALADRVWALSLFYGERGGKLAIMIAVKAVRRVLPIFEMAYTDDKRPRTAIELIEKRLKAPAQVKKDVLRKAAGTLYYDETVVATTDTIAVSSAVVHLIQAVLYMPSGGHSGYILDALRVVINITTRNGTKRTEQRRQQRDFKHALLALEKGE